MKVQTDTRRLTTPLAGGLEGATVAVEPLLDHQLGPCAVDPAGELIAGRAVVLDHGNSHGASSSGAGLRGPAESFFRAAKEAKAD